MAPRRSSTQGRPPSPRGGGGPRPPLVPCEVCGKTTRTWRKPAVCGRLACQEELATVAELIRAGRDEPTPGIPGFDTALASIKLTYRPVDPPPEAA